MKKLFVFVILVSLLIPSVAFAKPNGPISLTVNAEVCEFVEIESSYFGDWGWYKLELYVDGGLVGSKTMLTAKPQTISVDYSSSMSAGGHSATAKGYKWDWYTSVWILEDTDSVEFSVSACHDYSAKQKILNTCDEWAIYASIQDYGVELYKEYLVGGSWTDPYAYETVDRGTDYDPSYEITFPDGSTTILGTKKQISESIGCHEFTLNVIETSKCSGYYRKINLRDGGGWIKSLYMDKGPWTDPYTIEMLAGLTVPIPDVYGDDVVFGDLYEPAKCQVAHIASTFLNNDCEGWEVGYVFDGVGTVVDSGIWDDPIAYEEATFSSFVIPVPAGEIVDVTDGAGVLAGGTVNEPASCHEFTLNVIETSKCSGYYRKINLRDGGGWIKSLYMDKGPWTDPYTIEMLAGLTVPIPDVYGDDVVFGDLYEPEKCLVVLKHQFEITGEADCDVWGFTASSSDGGVGVPLGPTSGAWLDLYALESASVAYEVTWPDGYVNTFSGSVNEPERCLKGKKFSAEVIYDGCFGFEVVFSISEGGTLVLDEGSALSGIWLDPYKLEATVVSGKIVWLDETEDLFSYAVNEPAECFVCEVTEVYRQITLVDYDAEDWYYGKGSRNGSCWVLMTGEAESAAGVAVFRQADICSVCEYPDFIYKADKVLYDAYVTVDCNGKISYPDPLWKPEWFRADYENLAACRLPSCINK